MAVGPADYSPEEFFYNTCFIPQTSKDLLHTFDVYNLAESLQSTQSSPTLYKFEFRARAQPILVGFSLPFLRTRCFVYKPASSERFTTRSIQQCWYYISSSLPAERLTPNDHFTHKIMALKALLFSSDTLIYAQPIVFTHSLLFSGYQSIIFFDN